MKKVFNLSGQSESIVSRVDTSYVMGANQGAVAPGWETCSVSISHERSTKKKGSEYIYLNKQILVVLSLFLSYNHFAMFHK